MPPTTRSLARRSLALLPLLGLLFLLSSRAANAITVDQLSPDQNLVVDHVEFSGNHALSDAELSARMQTRPRPFYEMWKKRPAFDPVEFSTDLERLQALYQSESYYGAKINYDLEVKGDQVTPRIKIDEGKPVKVESIAVKIQPPDQFPAPDLKTLPLKRGDRFTTIAYQSAAQKLNDFYSDSGHAWVTVQRRAEVLRDRNVARVFYTVEPGPIARFGRTRVKGVSQVEPKIVLRELAYHPGDLYSSKKIAASRNNLLKLNLFSLIQIAPDPRAGEPVDVPMVLRVTEMPKHEISAGVTYSTQDLYGGQFSWSDYNFMGGGRQLSIAVQASSVTSLVQASLIQPYLFDERSKGTVSFEQALEIEQTFTLNASYLRARLDYKLTPQLAVFVNYRLDVPFLTGINPSVKARLGPIRTHGVVSGIQTGFTFDTTEDPYYPTQGYILTGNADQSGVIWGGQFRYYKLYGQAKKYTEIGWNTVLATRFLIGVGDSLGSPNDFPLYDRYWSGGEGSVRGYGRRRIGPLSASNDPLGGLAIVEGSAELRHHLVWKLNGAVFLDCGQVSLHRYDIPIDSVVFGAGPALSMDTPVGPVRFDLGFPFRRPRGDPGWQIYFTIGQFF